ncbi:MAG: gamma-glutamylcyclotransferase [Tildeniella nuda ZEHNDER 1965/U140]|nr:gamma-glutamylcyclotransferase [Tildeniella nuda ZEHNDER 1965/U140]
MLSSLDKAVIHVFVYGTLKRGEVNHHVCSSHIVQSRPAIAQGCLYTLPFGYPAMTLEAGIVQGELLSFAHSDILDCLDAFERHDPEEFSRCAPSQRLEQHAYERSTIATYDTAQRFLSLAWAYLMTREQTLALGGILLPDGRWHQTHIVN